MIETSSINKICKDFDLPFVAYNFEHFNDIFKLYKQSVPSGSSEYKNIETAETIVTMFVEADKILAKNGVQSSIVFKFVGDIMAFMWKSMKGETDESIKEFYDKFNTCDMNKCFPLEKTNIPSGDVYNFENLGKSFFSVDMSKAAFQAFKFAQPEVIYNAKKWDDYVDMMIGKFIEDAHNNTENPSYNFNYALDFTPVRQFLFRYISNSRNIRQVVFGKTNGGRLCHIEKYIMQEQVYKAVIQKFPTAVPVKLCNDEIIFKFDPVVYEGVKELFHNNNIFKVEAFTVDGMKIYQADEEAAQFANDTANEMNGSYSISLGNIIIRNRIDEMKGTYTIKCCPAKLRYFTNMFLKGATVINASVTNPAFTRVDSNGFITHIVGKLYFEKASV